MTLELVSGLQEEHIHWLLLLDTGTLGLEHPWLLPTRAASCQWHFPRAEPHTMPVPILLTGRRGLMEPAPKVMRTGETGYQILCLCSRCQTRFAHPNQICFYHGKISKLNEISK